MEEFQEVVFTENTTVATGAHAVRFKADVPKKVRPDVAIAALKLGAQTTKPVEPDVGLRAAPDPLNKPRKKRAPKRDA
jgi:hypothetical protein